jgi:hypothetical protein
MRSLLRRWRHGIAQSRRIAKSPHVISLRRIVKHRRIADSDAGMNTAEYAVGTLAAVAFAGLLLKVLTSDRVQAALGALIERALR